jgi:hypothetical protein
MTHSNDPAYRAPTHSLLKPETDSFFDKASADTGKLFDLKTAAQMIRPGLTALGLYRQLKRNGSEVIQYCPGGRIYLTLEQIDHIIRRNRRRLRRT